MQNFDYLIIGGGMACDAAVTGIREHDNHGTIGIISREEVPPYNRPPLSKALWKGEPEDTVWRKTDDKKVTMILSRVAITIDRNNKTVWDNKDESYGYRKLLIATGGQVNRLSSSPEEIIYYRTFHDYKVLRDLTSTGDDFLVIGGGFIGSEIAAALTMIHKKVTLLFPQKGICEGIFPHSLSEFLNEYYREKGVNVIPQDHVDQIKKIKNGYTIHTKAGLTFKVNGVVAGIGIKPDVSLAEKSGLLIDNGIKVNEFLQTSDADIYAAGDVANFYNPVLDKCLRAEHEDNANSMGRAAGKNMTGANMPYHYLSYFYSDLFDLGYEAVGDIHSGYEMVEQWKEKFKEGVIYYLHHGRVRGVLLWNTWNQVDHARDLITETLKFNKKNVLNRLPT